MIIFWIAAALLSAGAGALMLQGAVRARPAGADDPVLALHRRQLAEIDALAERGLLGEAEHKAARAEAGRRLLDAADSATAQEPTATPVVSRASRLAVLSMAVVAPLAAVGLYAAVAGAPGTPDQPFLARVADWKAHPQDLDWPRRVAIATVEAARHPNDPTLLKELAVANLFAGEGATAEAVARRAVALSPNDPEVYTLLAAAFTREAGAVTPSARQALAKAQAMTAALPATDPLRQRIEAQVQGVGEMAADSQQAAGPAQSTVAAAGSGQVTPAMIQQMVQRLAARLKANPDDPNGWVMLVKAYAVMGDIGARDAALSQARSRYAGDRAVLAALEQAKDQRQ